MQETSGSTINDPRRNSLASRSPLLVPSSSCHPERSEAPAERSRRPALSVVEGTPPLRATPKAFTNFLSRALRYHRRKHARLSTLAGGVNSEALVRSPCDGPAALSSAVHSHRCDARASPTGRFPGARGRQAHAEGLAEWGAGCRVLVLRCR